VSPALSYGGFLSARKELLIEVRENVGAYCDLQIDILMRKYKRFWRSEIVARCEAVPSEN
jgi:hypothetical protein